MKQTPLLILLSFYLICLLKSSQCYDLFSVNHEFHYDIDLSVEFGPFKSDDGWNVYGKLFVQRTDESTLAVWFKPNKVNISDDKVLDINENAKVITEPFRIELSEGSVKYVLLKADEPVWSANIKRAIAYALQVEVKDLYGVNEYGIHGYCKTDYFVTEESEHVLNVTKVPILETCYNGIHYKRHLNKANPFHANKHENFAVTYEGKYYLKHDGDNYYIQEATVHALSTLHTLESEGEAQYISSKIHLQKDGETTEIKTDMHFDQVPKAINSLKYENTPTDSLVKTKKTLAEQALFQLDRFDYTNVVTSNYIFAFDDDVGTLYQLIELFDEPSYWELLNITKDSYNDDKYHQINFDVIARVGTHSAVKFIHNLFTLEETERNSYATNYDLIKLVSFLPFHIVDPNEDVVKQCEIFMNLDKESYSKTMHDIATLAFSTIVYKSYEASKISTETFEKYAKIYYNYYLKSTTYAEKFLYIQTLGNLQLGNVIEYFDQIIRDTTQSDDLRFLAMYYTEPMVTSRPEKTYEIFWPIFAKKTNSLQLRIVAFTLLLKSNPTPGRWMSIHRVIQDETSPHIINFYRTTVLSMAGSTDPCYQKIRHILAYMERHLPEEPAKRFWVTGNYMFDYNNVKYGTNGAIRATLIGDEVNHTPTTGYFTYETEVSGRYTNQFGFYVKGRGVADLIYGVENIPVNEYLSMGKLAEILTSMKFQLKPKKDLHLEFITEIEGKSVFSGYYDSNSKFDFDSDAAQLAVFQKLFTEKLEMNHYCYNLDYYSKFKTPTAFGTPTNVFIQNNAVQYFEAVVEPEVEEPKLKISTDINYRLSSYLIYGSESYNPFTNTIHNIKRQQVFMIYSPLKFDFGFEMINHEPKHFVYTFYQPNDFGFSMQSRTGAETYGEIDGESDYKNYGNYAPEPELDERKFKVDDFGLTFEFKATDLNALDEIYDDFQAQINTNVLESGTQEGMDFLMDYISKTQLSNIYLTDNKVFYFVTSMDRNASIEFKFDGAADSIKDEYMFEIVMNQKPHKDEDFVAYQYKFVQELNTTNTDYFTYKTEFYRFDYTDKVTKYDIKDFRACQSLTYTPLDWGITPETLEYEVSFGFNTPRDVTGCPTTLPKLYVGFAEVSKKIENNDTEEEVNCPKDVIHFEPIPFDNVCTKETLKTYSEKLYYGFRVRYENIPEFMDSWFDRLSYVVSAWLPDKMELLDLHHGFNMSIGKEPEITHMLFTINDREIHVPNILTYLQYIPDIDYDLYENFDLTYGFGAYCSIINYRVNAFDETMLSLKDYLPTQDKYDTCSTLLVADCSENPIFALFLDVVHYDENEPFYGLKVYTGGNYVHLVPHPDHPHSMYVLEHEHCVNLNETDYTFKKETGNDDDLKISQDSNGIIDIYNDKFETKVQYNGKSVISIEVPTIFKEKLCGVCSTNYQKDVSYNYCSDSASTNCHK